MLQKPAGLSMQAGAVAAMATLLKLTTVAAPRQGMPILAALQYLTVKL